MGGNLNEWPEPVRNRIWTFRGVFLMDPRSDLRSDTEEISSYQIRDLGLFILLREAIEDLLDEFVEDEPLEERSLLVLYRLYRRSS